MLRKAIVAEMAAKYCTLKKIGMDE